MSSKFADHIKAATFNDRPHIEVFRRALLDAAPELPARTHAAILDHFVTAGLAANHDGGGAVQAAADTTSAQSGQHYEVVFATSAKGEKKAIKFPLLSVMQARAAAAARGEEGEFAGLLQRLRRVNYEVKVEEPIDIVRLNECLRASGMPIESRFELKTLLFQAGILQP